MTARLQKQSHRFLSSIVLALIVFIYFTPIVNAGFLTNRTVKLLDSSPSSTTDYIFNFTINNATPIGSMSLYFCANDPIQADPCDIPPGFDATNATLSSQSGITNFTMFVAAPNILVLSRPPSAITPPLNVSLTFHNITNANAAGPYFIRLATYSSTNATGSSIDFGGLAISYTNNLLISSYVPPYLIFCAGVTIPSFDCRTAAGQYVSFGEFSPNHSDQATSQLLVATNAASGYVIQINGNTMTSGNNTISSLNNPTVSLVGVSQFGLNLVTNTNPAVGNNPNGPGNGQPVNGYNLSNKFKFNSNDVIASSASPDDFRKFTVSYLVNINHSQAPGIYDSTLTYVATGSF